jgi:hypothetical protein
MPWGYSFLDLEYPLYLRIHFVSEISDFNHLKLIFSQKVNKRQIKSEKSASVIFWETCRRHVLS